MLKKIYIYIHMYMYKTLKWNFNQFADFEQQKIRYFDIIYHSKIHINKVTKFETK